MGKIILTIAAIAGLAYGLRIAIDCLGRRPAPPDSEARVEKTVRCTHCGAYMAPALASWRDGEAVCAAGCQQQARRKRRAES